MSLTALASLRHDTPRHVQSRCRGRYGMERAIARFERKTMTPEQIVEAAHVARWHTNPQARPEALGVHQWVVTKLLCHYWPQSSRAAILYALDHDTHELLTGDISPISKEKYPGLDAEMSDAAQSASQELGTPLDTDISAEDAARVKFCDKLAAYIHIEMFTPWRLDLDEWKAARRWLDDQEKALGVKI